MHSLSFRKLLPICLLCLATILSCKKEKENLASQITSENQPVDNPTEDPNKPTGNPKIYFIAYGKNSLGDTTHYKAFNAYLANEIIWEFGDGNYSKDSVTQHVYKKTGTYLVRLRVNGSTYAPFYDPESDDTSTNIIILQPPTPYTFLNGDWRCDVTYLSKNNYYSTDTTYYYNHKDTVINIYATSSGASVTFRDTYGHKIIYWTGSYNAQESTKDIFVYGSGTNILRCDTLMDTMYFYREDWGGNDPDRYYDWFTARSK